MARNDGRSRVSDIFGKPGVTFPYDDLSYVRIVEQRTASQDTKLKPLGTAHDRTTTALLTATNTAPGDNNDTVLLELYETLPGPWIPFTRYDQTLGPIQGKRRAVVNTSQPATLTATVKTTYEARGQSDYVSWEIVETNSDGTGSASNPAYPTLVEDLYDEGRGAVQRTSQAFTATGTEVGSIAESGGSVTKISYEPINQFLLRKIIETWTVPGPLQTGHLRSSSIRGKNVDITIQEGDSAVAPESGNLIISSKVQPLSAVHTQRTTEKVASLPPDETWCDYQYVSIPRRIFSLNPTNICNGTDQGVTVTWKPISKPGGSFLRKHRTTVSYSLTAPGDTALNVFTPTDLDYDGRVINHHFHGVLNDAMAFSNFFTQGTCVWEEAFTFPASSPSASGFSGQWWLASRQSEPWGTTGWRTVTIEFYEP